MRQFVSDCDNLRIVIYLIGYPDQGESQVLLVFDKSDGAILVSGVIDCYCSNNVNRTFDILTSYKIKKLNFFCWTHTDDDHSVGTGDILDNFCDSSTQFFLPEGIYGNSRDFTTYSKHIQEAIDKINAHNKGTKYTVSTVTVASQSSMHLDVLEKEFIDNKRQRLLFRVIALAPNSALIRRRMEKGLRSKNDTSIALKVQFGGFNGFLAGDIEDQTIAQIQVFHFDDLAYIKTPHHTSLTSGQILNKLNDASNLTGQLPIACSTTYLAHQLPNLGLVNKYRGYAKKFASTGSASGGHQFGSVRVEYDDTSSVSLINLDGNAEYLF